MAWDLLRWQLSVCDSDGNSLITHKKTSTTESFMNHWCHSRLLCPWSEKKKYWLNKWLYKAADSRISRDLALGCIIYKLSEVLSVLNTMWQSQRMLCERYCNWELFFSQWCKKMQTPGRQCCFWDCHWLTALIRCRSSIGFPTCLFGKRRSWDWLLWNTGLYRRVECWPVSTVPADFGRCSAHVYGA